MVTPPPKNPVPASVPPPATVTGLLLKFPVTSNVPSLTVVVPVCVLLPVNVRMPLPLFTRFAVP